MPHGPLTPLGRQLRSVLGALRPVNHGNHHVSTALGRASASSTGFIGRTRGLGQPQGSYVKVQSREQHAAAVAVQSEPSAQDQRIPQRRTSRSDGLSRRRLARRTRVDYLSQELIKAGKKNVTPQRPKRNKQDASYYDAQKRGSKAQMRKNAERHRKDFIPDLDQAASASANVLNILARYVHFLESKRDNLLEADWVAVFEMSREEEELLRRKGYIMEDIKAWAAVVMEEDSYAAAKALQKRVSVHGMNSVPLAVVTYFFRRPYISARALRILILHAWDHFAHIERDTGHPPDPATRFIVVNRLLRHAREVWPQALEAIIEHMIQFTPNVAKTTKDRSKLIKIITYQMNKAMTLVSQATAVSPYKDIRYQEAPIVRILSYMANHDPALQINRDGYRAVVRIQLAQKKTESEEKWAQLKSLSWPPWKEDRTRMDAKIGPEHGISKAGETLERMKEAGYQPEPWEQLAQVYSGWDVDGTPTIQTRVFMSANVGDTSLTSAVWAARIRTTRTAQEAWACYLAYEDTKLPTDHRVLMAIFRVLHQEERRQRAEKRKLRYPKQDEDGNQDPLHPGDVREVSPLPPSSHQYTYTRSAPPTVHELYLQLKQQDAELRDSCLAFLIANAESFKVGIEYLRSVHQKYILDRPASADSYTESDPALVPWVLFDAYIELLARHPSVNLNLYRDIVPELARMFGFGLNRNHGPKFNMFHSLGQAIDLLRARRPRSQRVWNAVATALSNGTADQRTHLAEYDVVARDTKWRFVDMDRNTIAVYRLFKHVQDLHRKQHVDLDPLGFLAYCRATEGVTMASWSIALRGDDSSVLDRGPWAKFDEESAALLLAQGVPTEDRPYRRVQYHFKLLVGQDSSPGPPRKRRGRSSALQQQDPDGPKLPVLLHAPGPAILHAYIRALGWCAAYEPLLETLRWMAEHRAQLDEARERDRNGEAVMRRAIVAVAVFMGRAWVNPGRDRDTIEGDQEVLRRLETPAPAEQLQEARELVEDWGGWPTETEVRHYCQDPRFDLFR